MIIFWFLWWVGFWGTKNTGDKTKTIFSRIINLGKIDFGKFDKSKKVKLANLKYCQGLKLIWIWMNGKKWNFVNAIIEKSGQKKAEQHKKWIFPVINSKMVQIIISILAEVTGAARVNMQFAEHLCPSGFRVSGPPGQGGQTCIKTFLRQVGMCMQNFIKIGAVVWISIRPPHTNRWTNK